MTSPRLVLSTPSASFHPLLAVLALLSLLAAADAENLDLLILHNNDMHARFEETTASSGTCTGGAGCVGGFARVAHVVRDARQRAQDGTGRQVLFLNAGDTFTGTTWFSVHKWQIAADFLNLVKPDAMCLGNHEFDLYPEGAASLIQQLNFPTVAANLDFSEELAFNNISVPKSVVVKIAGRKIGIVGYLTPSTVQISFTGKVKFNDEIESLKAETEKLNEEGVNIIIALGHSGFKMDKKIAAEVPLVDLVVGGHTNTFLWNGKAPSIEKPQGPYPFMVKQSSGKQVPVVQAYAYTKYMGRLNVTFDDKGDLVEASGQPLYLDSSIEEESDVLTRLSVYRPSIERLNVEVVGTSKVLLDGDSSSCRFRECNFGNMITDAFVAYRSSVAASSYWTDSPIAILNGGAIRGSINATSFGGNVTRGEILGVLPFDNQIYTASISGKDLVTTLELAARSNGETSHGEFLQVSGLKVVYDYNQPTGSRVISAQARCADCRVPQYSDIQANGTYKIITTQFLLSGGDGHYALSNGTFDSAVEDLNDVSIVEWYMGKKSPVYPEVFGRLKVIAADEDDDDDGTGSGSVLCSLGWFTFLGFVVLNIVR